MSNNVEDLKTRGQKALAKAKAEIEQEMIDEAVGKLKELYKQQTKAQTVLENINREIEDYEAAVNQGNLGG